MRRGVALIGCAVVAASCARRDARPPPPSVDAAVATAAESVDAAVQARAEPMPWADAIRLGRWNEAKEGLSRLAPPERDKPEVRLARARVLLSTGQPAEALAVLEKLDDELPLLRDLVRSLRAHARFEVGPFDKAAEYLGSRREVASLVLAAEAWDKAGDATKSRAAWDRVIASDKKTRAQEEHARARRMQIARLKDGEAAAASDARWLATSALDDKVFAEAASVLEALRPPALLTPSELLARARVLADAARTDDALRTIERAALRGSVPPLELCRARAEAYWKARTRYPEAALSYRACAALGGAHAGEDLFMVARAFLRADRDGDAIPVFQAVIQKYPRTKWADQAEFHIARATALAGRWREAAALFDDYVKHWPTGKERREAERYRAIAHLLVRDDKRARKLLEELSGAAEDPFAAARWTNLAAVAALNDGDRLHAMSRWAEVARSRPLSYAALVARARIVQNGGSPPPAIEPAASAVVDPLVVELPAPVDMLHRIGFDAEAEEALRDRESAVVARTPTRGTEALCTAYAMLGRGKRRCQVSLSIDPQVLSLAPGPKNRGAWECMFPRAFEGVVRRAATTARLSPDLVWSVMRQESAFDPEVVSPARAVGLMQLLPETAHATAVAAAAAPGQEIDDARLTTPEPNVALGTRYLRGLLDKFAGQEPLAIAAYNAGPESVQRWLSRAKIGTLDVFVEVIPFLETRGYVVRVLGNLGRYGYLDRGEAGVPSLALDLK